MKTIHSWSKSMEGVGTICGAMAMHDEIHPPGDNVNCPECLKSMPKPVPKLDADLLKHEGPQGEEFEIWRNWGKSGWFKSAFIYFTLQDARMEIEAKGGNEECRIARVTSLREFIRERE